MPEVVDTPEEIEAHKNHALNPCPETCDLCWMKAPFTKKEVAEITEAQNGELIPWE